jgi:bifunctional UDP-N-acetylglucosamine pyrophosphorylase / glucosamine-1-phosphate N-acetyltransferase
LGAEGPLTADNCTLGHNVSLKGGFISNSVFLDDSEAGSAAHIRPGTLFEEQTATAHAVGLKQTILFPFALTGSLVNFCDVLLAGGLSRSEHSEVGSSFVHFNYTPHGDKATASLLGDVPRGVFLDQPPIFLGGQGGIVGPLRMEYGTVLAAGSVLRRDALDPNRMLFPAAPARPETAAFDRRIYRGARRIVLNNLTYIGNILALDAWYRLVRRKTMAPCSYRNACREAAVSALDTIISERLNRLDQLRSKLEFSVQTLDGLADRTASEETERQRHFVAHWSAWRDQIEALRERYDTGDEWTEFSRCPFPDVEDGHVAAMQHASPAFKEAGRRWLEALVERVVSLCRVQA